MAITKKSIEGNTFRDFDGEIDEEHIANAQRCAIEAVKEAGLLRD